MKQNMMRVVVVEILPRLFIIPRKELYIYIYIYIVRAVSPLYRKETSEGIMFNDSSESESSLPILYVLPDTTVIVSPHDTAAVFKPCTPNEDMTQEVCDIILEEVIGRKITLELQNNRLSLEMTTHNVCQDVAVAITSTDWQKEIRRHLQLHSK